MKRAVCAEGMRIEYILIQSVRRDVLIQAVPEGITRVYAPKTMRLREIDETVRKNAALIQRMHQDVDRRIDELRRDHPLGEGLPVSVEGRPRILRLHAGREPWRLDQDEIHLWVDDPGDEEGVRAALRSALANLALERIRERLEYYAPRVGGTFGRVTIREQKSRWGSCSSKHNLNFNWKLIMAPPQVLDYVVIHELCHLHEFNHSERFWKRVEAQMPEYEAWKKWLKIHGSELMI